MKQVSIAQALEILKSRPSTFASVTYRTPQDKLNKGRGSTSMIQVLDIDPDKIFKTTTATVLVGTKVSYQTLVENRLAKESDLKGTETPEFESEGRKWGERIDGVEVQHKGEVYATFYFVANNIPKVSYSLDDKEIDLSDAKFDSYRKPEKAEAGRQLDAGIENPVLPRDVNMGNVLSFSVGGETYEIVK